MNERSEWKWAKFHGNHQHFLPVHFPFQSARDCLIRAHIKTRSLQRSRCEEDSEGIAMHTRCTPAIHHFAHIQINSLTHCTYFSFIHFSRIFASSFCSLSWSFSCFFHSCFISVLRALSLFFSLHFLSVQCKRCLHVFVYHVPRWLLASMHRGFVHPVLHFY